MKTLKKILAIFLIIAVSAVIFVSCSEEKSKKVASYGDNQYIYEDDADFSDFYNLNRYFHSYKTGNDVTDVSEYNTILSYAVKETIILRVFEEELAEKGHELDLEAIRAVAESDIKTFETAYSGGFEQFCKDWSLSEDVFFLYNKYETIKEMAEEYVKVNVSESEAKEYYDKNPEKYFKTPHYDVKTIFLQVLDPFDEKEMTEAYNDAIMYIEILNSGRKWETVKETAFLKYNSDYGMAYTEMFSCLNHVYTKYFTGVIDLDEAVLNLENQFFEEHGMTFKEMFPGNFEDYANKNKLQPETKEYNRALEIYMNYASKMYNIEFEYAINTYWEEGKTYGKPIYNAVYDSYVIVTFDRIEEEEVNISFIEAKDEIMEILIENEKEKEVENYISERMNELKVKIEYK